MSLPAPTPASARRSGGRRIRLGLMLLFIVGVFVQFYLAGRGVFGASNYDAHRTWGNILHLFSLVILIATIAIPASRNGRDIGMAFGLLVLVTIQMMIGNFDHKQVAAFHPVLALVILGLAFGMLKHDRVAVVGGA